MFVYSLTLLESIFVSNIPYNSLPISSVPKFLLERCAVALRSFGHSKELVFLNSSRPVEGAQDPGFGWGRTSGLSATMSLAGQSGGGSASQAQSQNLCRYYAQGLCKYGDSCFNVHKWILSCSLSLLELHSLRTDNTHVNLKSGTWFTVLNNMTECWCDWTWKWRWVFLSFLSFLRVDYSYTYQLISTYTCLKSVIKKTQTLWYSRQQSTESITFYLTWAVYTDHRVKILHAY